MAQPSLQPRKQTNLETANEMYKAAFIVKKQKFTQENPKLSDAELNRKTADYFRRLAENPVW
jgi:hypothetical protein